MGAAAIAKNFTFSGAELSDLRNRAARANLRIFIEQTMPDFKWNWHHALTVEIIQAWLDGEIPERNLMISMPPRHGKSEIVSRRLPAFLLGQTHTEEQIIAATYGAELAQQMNRDVQRIMDSAAYRAIFPETILPRSAEVTQAASGYVRNAHKFEIPGTKKGYRGSGIRGAITGTGFTTGIIDDPIKNMEEAQSNLIRERNWEWYTSTFLTREEAGARQLVTQTRWHTDDLSGRILNINREDWHVVSLPALMNRRNKLLTLHPKDFRKDGQSLWPGKKTPKELHKIRDIVPAKVWNSLYQQTPTPSEGSIWRSTDLQKITREDLDKINLTSAGFDWDLAYTTKEANSASAWIRSAKYNNNLYILDAGWIRLEFPELIDLMKSKTGPHYIEDKASGKSAKQALSRQGLSAILVPVYNDKISRTYSATPYARSGRVYVAEDLYEKILYDQEQGIVNLSTENPDIDLNDALTQAINRQLGRTAGKTDWSDLDAATDFLTENEKF